MHEMRKARRNARLSVYAGESGILSIMSKSILVSGSLAYDRIMDFPDLFRDHFIADKLHSISVSFSVSPPTVEFGGTAGNVAYTLALLHETPSIVSTVGHDFEDYRKHFESLGIGTDLIRVATDLPTSSAYIITDKADNQITAFSVAAGNIPYEKTLEASGCGAAMIGANCVKDMVHIPDFCRKNRIPFFYDPGQKIPSLSADELKKGMEGATAVFANDYELALIKEKTGLDESGIVNLAHALVVTYGAEGSLLKTKDGEERIPAAKVETVVDPTGAGDAHRAGFLKGFVSGAKLSICAKVGSVAGAYAVERYGTQNHRFTAEEFKARYEAAYGETIPF